MSAPLERMFPNRCYDCLKPIPHDDLLCESCKAMYPATHPQNKGASPDA